MADKKITECTVGPMPRPMPEGMFDPMPAVKVVYDDGTEEKLFEFYPDEIKFAAEEFIGRTKLEAFAIRHGKDVKWLQSESRVPVE
jgi:hypothetical protein